MNENLDDLEDLMHRAHGAPWGKTCSALWAQAANLAEERGDLENAIVCYDELIDAYRMGGESTRCVAPFLWLVRTHKERPDLFDAERMEALALDYKFAASTVLHIPTVSYEQCMSLLEQMENFHRNLGDSMRSYNLRAFYIYTDMGMTEEAEAAFHRWLAAEPSELSDCSHCDPGHRVRYHARRGEWDEALRIGEATLSETKEHCGSQPERLLTEMLEVFLRQGRDEQAWAAFLRGYRRYQQAPPYLVHHEYLLRYLALSGRVGRPQRLERGLTILLRHMPWWKEAETPTIIMRMAAAGFVLLDSFDAEHDDRVLPVTLPGGDLQWIEWATLTNPTVAQAREWMRDLALAMADHFDARPGHPHPGVTRVQVEELLDPDPVPPLPQLGVIEDASGLGDYTMMTTFATSDEASSHNEAQSASTSGVEQTADSDEDDRPLVPLNVNGPWESMTFMELMEAAIEFGENVPSIYLLQARERVHRAPSLLAPANRPTEEGRLQRYWDYLVEHIRFLSTLEGDVPDEPIQSEDRAYQLIQEADELSKARKYMEAAALADQAMRTASVEPIGVRLSALTTIATAAVSAGYVAESIDTGRELLNLNALLGLKVYQVGASLMLTDALIKLRRKTEAAAVAQSALDVLEHYPHLYGPAVALNGMAAEAQADFADLSAARHHYAAAVALERNEVWPSAAGAYARAAEAFAEANEDGQAMEARERSTACARRHFDACQEELDHYRDHKDSINPDGERSRQGSDDVREAQLLKEAASSLENLIRGLYSQANTIVMQPGNISDKDFARMEALMDEVRAISANPSYASYLSKTPAWRDADWHREMSGMLMNAYRESLAVGYMNAAADAFAAIGDVREQGRTLWHLAEIFMHLEDAFSAREAAQAVVDLFADPKYQHEQSAVRARRLIREIDEALGNDDSPA